MLVMLPVKGIPRSLTILMPAYPPQRIESPVQEEALLGVH